VRSLTKLWSLAGVRAGYLLGPPELVADLDAQRQPWSVNALACAAVVACCGDRETPARVAAEVEVERRFLGAGLGRVAQRVWPGAANFLLMHVSDGPGKVAALQRRGISVRPCGSFPGLDDDHLRVAIRRRADNERLLAWL
jgi:histidinol-phosphate/aromatic aminotransferase/cobyric acid decarboxylase-like protein